MRAIPERLYLVVVHAPSSTELGRQYVVSDLPVTAGRAAGNEIVLADAGVSRTHAQLERRADGFWVVDHSKHGTFVDDERIGEKRLADGALLRLGSIVLRASAGPPRRIVDTTYSTSPLDGLTGLLDRASLFALTDDAWASACAHDSPLAFVLLGLDAFRHVNATYGHLAGDEVLRSIARLTTTHVRPEDALSRYSGDTLAWLLPSTDAVTASVLSESLREAIASHEVESDGHCITVTASVGIAERAMVSSVEGLLAAALVALHRAKQKR